MMKRPTMALAAVGAFLTLALPALGSSPEPDGRGPFADVDGSVHEMDVAALWEAGITSGCSQWLYCPDEELTREQAAAFLTRALELPRSDPSGFNDTQGSIFEGSIGALVEAGITAGCADDEFCPEKPLTREQMASLLVRAMELPVGQGGTFSDDDDSIHQRDIEALAAAGITHGCDDGLFCPERTVTREEMASFVARALDLDPPAEMPEIPTRVLEELQTPDWPTQPGPEGWRPLVDEYFPHEVDRAMRVLACESNGNPRARNPRSGASGLFQHMPGSWAERAAGAGFPGASIFDPEANVAAAAWLVYDARGGGWHHWVCK